MKKFFAFSLFAIIAMAASSQNVQLHYDFGRLIYPEDEGGRQNVTMTVEKFSADKWGSWFYFVDVDFSNKFVEGAYAEISREFNLGKQSPFAAHVEYNGGLNRFGSFQQAALVGAAWNGHNADFSTTYSVQLMYKQFFKSYGYTHGYASAQLTGVWSTTFANKALTFSGFIDFWRGERNNGHGKLVVLTEPQLWYNLKNEHLSIGTEVEISNNFIYPVDDKLFINPTLALKWRF